jgi:ATP synthase I chain
MARNAEPERAIVRRVVPFGPPAALVALLAGWWLAGGWGTGWSAALGVVVVVANAAANALLLSRAARISLTAYSAAVMGGFVIRLGLIVAIMFALNRLDWFSPLAFGLAVVPATILLLAYEMKLVAGGLGRELHISSQGPRQASREAAK